MSSEEEAAHCRNGLSSTLQSVHEFTAGSTRPAWELLHRMNGVLRASSETNFGAASLGPIDDLRGTIAYTEQGMVERCEDLPLLYFARSFAVVLEDVVRKLEEATTTTVPEMPPYSETNNERSVDERKEEDGEKTPPPEAADGAAVADSEADSRVEAWRREMQRRNPGKVLDFSPEAIEGRLAIYNVPRSLKCRVLRSILRQFGRIIEFYMPARRPHKGDHFALAKMESNRAADDAVAWLNQRDLAGARLIAKRAEYYSEYRQDEVRQYRQQLREQDKRRFLKRAVQPMVQRVQQPEPPSSCSQGKDENGVDEAVELGDDRSDGSFFSID